MAGACRGSGESSSTNGRQQDFSLSLSQAASFLTRHSRNQTGQIPEVGAHREMPPKVHGYWPRTVSKKISCQNDAESYDRGTKLALLTLKWLCRSLAAFAGGSVVPGRSPGAIIPGTILELTTVAASNQAVRRVPPAAGRQVFSPDMAAGTAVIKVGTGVDVGHTNLPVIWVCMRRCWGASVVRIAVSDEFETV
jgi:hypothetical protein